MSNHRPSLPRRDSVKLFFTLGFLGALWFAVISALLDTPSRSGTQWASIGILAVLTILMLFFLDRTSEGGLVKAVKSAWPRRKSTPSDDS